LDNKKELIASYSNLQPMEGEEEERVMRLAGDDAKAFAKYDTEQLPEEEIKSLDEAKEVYRKYSSKSKC
jgi:hypothetical protein